MFGERKPVERMTREFSRGASPAAPIVVALVLFGCWPLITGSRLARPKREDRPVAIGKAPRGLSLPGLM